MDAEAILRLLQGVDDLNTRPIIRDIQLALIEVRQLKQTVKELEEPNTCEECKISKTCKTLNFVYKQRLKNEGYAMYKNEFYCNQFEAIF